jgi:hypothetical protein
MKTDYSGAIRTNLEPKSSDELLCIWNENDRNQWSPAAFDVIQGILRGRGVSFAPHPTPSLAAPPPLAITPITSERPSRLLRFMAGPIGLVIALGFLVGFSRAFLQTPIAEQIGVWASWGLLGIVLLAASGIVLLLLTLFIAIFVQSLAHRYKANKEGKLLMDRGLPDLHKALADGNPVIRRAALRALGKEVAGKRAGVEEIAQCLGDDDETVATVAAETLEKLGPAAIRTVAALLEATRYEKHKTNKFRSAVIKAIGRIGHNREQHETLEELSKEPWLLFPRSILKRKRAGDRHVCGQCGRQVQDAGPHRPALPP